MPATLAAAKLFTRFGTPCTIVAAPEPSAADLVDGATPVDVICHDEDGTDRSLKTWASELRADGGLNEIMAEVDRVRAASKVSA